MFSMQSVSQDPLIATFHLSAATLNLGRSQNGVSGNGLSADWMVFAAAFNIYVDGPHHFHSPYRHIRGIYTSFQKKVCNLFPAIFHCPLCLMSTYLVPKSRSENVHYNRDF